MANEEVLRLRTTVVSEEGLAQIRAIGREIGLMPSKAKPHVEELNKGFRGLTDGVKHFGEQLVRVIPGLEEFGLGAASATLGAALLVKTLTSISSKIVELQYASKELGMSERDLRAWGLAAEKAGIAPQTLISNLKSFRDVSQGFKYNIGGVRDELVAMGAGPVVARIMAARTETDKLKQAFDFKDALMKADPSGYQARKFFEMVGLGADAARLSFDEFERAREHVHAFSPEEIERAKKFHDAMIELGHAWEQLLQKFAISLFPKLQQDIKDIEWIIGLIEKLQKLMGGGEGAEQKPTTTFWQDFENWRKSLPVSPNISPRVGGGRLTTPPEAPEEPNLLQRRSPNLSPRSGYRPTAYTEGFGGGGNLSEFSKAVKDGVFAALVDFKSYVETGGAAAGGGFTAASFGGSAGAAAGGGAGGAPATGGFKSGGGYTVMPEGGAAPPGVGVRGPGESQVPRGGAPASLPDLARGAAGGPRAMESRGGSAGITAPAGTAVQREGMATVTSASGRKFQVDQRFAANFQGFINDYEKAGGVIGPESGTLGSRPHNPSGHPIGAAIDINQIGYGVRGRGGKTLPVGTENELAEKWGLVSGANWRHPDTGHFGIKDVETARKALIDQGVSPGVATDIAKGQAGEAAKAAGRTDGKTVRGSWFGSGPGWHDPSEAAGRKTASGLPNTLPGIALPSRAGLGKMFEVTTPDGRTFMLPQTDIGPSARTGRGIDITSAAASQMGYSAKNFPTDKGFSYRPMDDQTKRIDQAVDTTATGGVKAEGNVNVAITSNGTAARARADTSGSLWQQSTIRNYQQMQKTEAPSPPISH